MTDQMVFKDFRWVDVINPTREDLLGLAETYHLHRTSVEDMLEPEHLPKSETFENLTFLVLRAFNDECADKCSRVFELTRKVSIFYGPQILLTVHHKPSPYVEKTWAHFAARSDRATKPVSVERVLVDIFSEIVSSYQIPLAACHKQLDQFEDEIFGHGTRRRFRLLNSYYLRRRAVVLKQVLRSSLEPLARVQSQITPGPVVRKLAPLFQNVREQIEAELFSANDVGESLTALINLHLSVQSQRSNEASRRTNEVMRVLTVFSCVFLPINSIAAIYGMNFEFLPEFHFRYGYPLALGMMAVTGLITGEWFRRRGWLKGTNGPNYEP